MLQLCGSQQVEVTTGTWKEGLNNCWSANWSHAVIVRIPAFAVMPLESPSDQFPLQLKRTRRDFGITATIVAAVGASVVAATAAGLALSQTVQQAAVINTLSERVASALDIQQTLNGQLHFGILMLNQQAVLL